jgi:uncharacterized protein
MRKVITFLLTLIIFICIFIVFSIKSPIKSYVRLDGKQFYVDVAKTKEQQEKGLDIYSKLPITRGMIFPFRDAGYYSFWMKGMKFPIDIIYINNNKIVDIFTNVPYPKDSIQEPVIIRPSQKANFVLEINAGLSRKYNFKKGDLVKIQL